MPTELPKERAVRPAGSLELDPSCADLTTDETVKLIAATKVIDTAVYDQAGERIGTVHDVMVDKISGQVAYVVVSSGGFLGLGDERRAVPWNALTYSEALGGYVVGLDPGAPQAASAELAEPA